jgi:ankyrin repeat protein
MPAASQGHVKLAEYIHFLLRPPDVEGRVFRIRVGHGDKEGNTALFLATGWGKLEVVRWLLEAGLHGPHKNYQGQTAVRWAAGWGRKPVMEDLLRKCLRIKWERAVTRVGRRLRRCGGNTS